MRRMDERSRRQGADDPWIISEARRLAYEPDPGSIQIGCVGWPLAFAVLPPLWLTRSRILVVGPQHAALFLADSGRQDLLGLLWSGKTSDIDVRRTFRWFLGGKTPNGCRFSVDAPPEARRLSNFLSSA